MSIFLFLFLCLLGGVFYRLGGSSLNIKFKTKIRDLGVPLVGLVCLLILMPYRALWAYWGAMAWFVGLSFGSLCTYWDHWGTDNVEWYEWALTGFFYGLSAIPIAFYTHRWIGFVLRTVILTVFMPLSNRLQFTILWDNTDGVEGSRGFLFIATIPLLLI